MKRCLAMVGLAALAAACCHLRAGEPAEADSSQEPISVILVPHERATLSAEVPSSVAAIRREMGEIFKAGEPLLLLDKTIYEANRDKAKAQVSTSQTQLQSKLNLRAGGGGASEAEVETAKMNLAVARANLVLAEKQLESCTLSAPYEGRVVTVHVNRYEVVQAGQELIDIVDDRVLRAQFLVRSITLPLVEPGASVRIKVYETGSYVIGRISHVGAVIDPASSSVKVFAEVDNRDRLLAGGMRGTLALSDIVKQRPRKGRGDGKPAIPDPKAAAGEEQRTENAPVTPATNP